MYASVYVQYVSWWQTDIISFPIDCWHPAFSNQDISLILICLFSSYITNQIETEKDRRFSVYEKKSTLDWWIFRLHWKTRWHNGTIIHWAWCLQWESMWRNCLDKCSPQVCVIHFSPWSGTLAWRTHRCTQCIKGCGRIKHTWWINTNSGMCDAIGILV